MENRIRALHTDAGNLHQLMLVGAVDFDRGVDQIHLRPGKFRVGVKREVFICQKGQVFEFESVVAQ